jgi:hypothetical protein
MRLQEENFGPRKFSSFVVDAIVAHLDAHHDSQIQNASSRRLMAVLLSRDDVDEHLKEEILRRLNLEHSIPPKHKEQ